MNENLYDIDSAMNIIRDEITRELSECVSNQNKKSSIRHLSTRNLSFSDENRD